MEDKKHVYLTMHEKFVREDISYIDQRTGEEKTFNSVTLPKNTVIDGVDVGYCQFSPLFVNPSRFKGEHFRDIPLLAAAGGVAHPHPARRERRPRQGRGREGREGHREGHARRPQGGSRQGRKEFLASLDEKAKEAREASQNQDREARHAEPAVR